jgi:CheY-like chemotaxis protein
LVLARRLAVAMGGNVSLSWSLPGGGSCFAIDVQLALPQSAESSATNAEVGSSNVEAASSRLPLKGRRVLVVDDSLDNQALVTRILQLWGAEVELANDGVEGVQKALERSYNVVLMDLQMPRLGGIEATKILRDRGFKDPIVALTARHMNEDRVRCLSIGCNDFVSKPIERERLAEVLGRVTQSAAGYSN